nr:MAG TPA: hypothetical protein [Caudoviricetes sp.]
MEELEARQPRKPELIWMYIASQKQITKLLVAHL